MLSLNQVKGGSKIVFRGSPHEVIEANHLKMGRGGAKLNTKLRNLLDRSIIDYTFAGEERLVEAETYHKSAQFLYAEGQTCHFMLNDTYEQVSIEEKSGKQGFLKDGEKVDLLFWQERVIDIVLPKKIALQVSYTEPGTKGNTVNAALKPATLETGTVVKVPLFIKTGDVVEISTETGEYSGRL